MAGGYTCLTEIIMAFAIIKSPAIVAFSQSGAVVKRDGCLWPSHLEGPLAALIPQMKAGDRVLVKLNGTVVEFARMADSKKGQPTFGLKAAPGGVGQAFWNAIFRDPEQDSMPARVRRKGVRKPSLGGGSSPFYHATLRGITLRGAVNCLPDAPSVCWLFHLRRVLLFGLG